MANNPRLCAFERRLKTGADPLIRRVSRLSSLKYHHREAVRRQFQISDAFYEPAQYESYPAHQSCLSSSGVAPETMYKSA